MLTESAAAAEHAAPLILAKLAFGDSFQLGRPWAEIFAIDSEIVRVDAAVVEIGLAKPNTYSAWWTNLRTGKDMTFLAYADPTVECAA